MKEWIVGIIIFGVFIAFVVYLHYKFNHETFEEEKKFFDEVQAFNDSAEKLKEAIYDEIIDPWEALLAKWILNPWEAFLEKR